MRTPNKVFQAASHKAAGDYENSRNLINGIVLELGKGAGSDKYRDFFLKNGEFLQLMMDHYDAIKDEAYFQQDFEVLLANNHELYGDITEPAYQTSYVNPTYAVGQFGTDMGRCLSAIAYLFREYVGFVYEGRLWDMQRLNALYLMVYELILEKGTEEVSTIAEGVRDHLLVDIDVKTRCELVRRLSPEFDVYSHIVESYDLNDLRYLFRYGMYVADNEIRQAEFVMSLPDEKKKLVADTYTEAYFRGFERNNIALDHKTSVHVVYSLGFESIMRKAYENFRARGLEPFAFYYLRGMARR